MRLNRSLLFCCLAGAFALVSTGVASACTASSAMVSGSFNEDGNFVIASALNSKGEVIEGVEGYVCSSVSTAKDLSLVASDMTGQTIYLTGDVNFDDKALHVASYTQCAKTAEAKVASVRAAGTQYASGSGCSSSKAAAKAASAQVANASSCGSKAKAASANYAAGSSCSSSKGVSTASAQVANSAGCCASKAAVAKSAAAKTVDAQIASAPTAQVANSAGCCASKAAAAKTASAQVANASSCSASKAAAKAASAQVANASSCSSSKAAAKAASAQVANASSCGSFKASNIKTATTDAGTMIVFNVSGLTCGGCVSKVQSAVAALELEGIEGCEVDLEKGQAFVKVSKDVDAEALKDAIVSAGFGAELDESETAQG